MKNKKAFTLIELIVVMGILGIIFMSSFAGYGVYRDRSSLKLASRELAQEIKNAKDLAIYGVQEDDKNKDVGLYLHTNKQGEENIIYYFYYDLQTSEEPIRLNIDKSNIIKKVNLQKNVNIKKIYYNEDKTNSGEDLFLYFNSITGDPIVFYGEGNWQKSENTRFIIELVYGESDFSTLTKELTYYLNTNTIDYEKN